MTTDKESNERVRAMIGGIFVVFMLHLIIFAVSQLQTVTHEPIIVPFWVALVVDLICIGLIAVMGIFA